MHDVPMKSRSFAVVALGLCIALGSANSSFADATPTPSPTADYQTLLAQYKSAMTAFQSALKLREQDRMKINQIFMAAVNDANRTAKTALKGAKTPTAKSDVLTAQRTAIALANSIRDAAILSMGQPPVEPVEPVKPPKSTQMSPTKKTKLAKASPSPSS